MAPHPSELCFRSAACHILGVLQRFSRMWWRWECDWCPIVLQSGVRARSSGCSYGALFTDQFGYFHPGPGMNQSSPGNLALSCSTLHNRHSYDMFVSVTLRSSLQSPPCGAIDTILRPESILSSTSVELAVHVGLPLVYQLIIFSFQLLSPILRTPDEMAVFPFVQYPTLVLYPLLSKSDGNIRPCYSWFSWITGRVPGE